MSNARTLVANLKTQVATLTARVEGIIANNHLERLSYFESDRSVASELVQHIDNSREMVDAKVHVYKNLSRKKAKGVYDSALATKLFMHLATVAAKHYGKTHDLLWNQAFTVAIRKEAAQILEREFEEEYADKNYKFME